MVDCSPYTALTRHLRGLGPDEQTRTYTFGELHAALGVRLPMGAEVACSWDSVHGALGRAVAAAGFRADLCANGRGWEITFRRAAPGSNAPATGGRPGLQSLLGL